MEILYRKYRAYVFITITCLLSTFILWLPFIIRSTSINSISTPNVTFDEIRKNWDGPLYIVPAKTLYDKDHSISLKSPLGLPYTYFAAHLPLYPLAIRALATMMTYPTAMLIATVLAGIALFNFFYYAVKKMNLSKYPLALTFVFMFFTPRFLVARSVGSPETLFMVLLLGSLFFFAQKKYLLAGLLGGLSILTKSPGGLLFFAYVAYFIFEYKNTKKFDAKWLWILLIPGAFLGLCLFYQQQIGDFWAYFNSGDNLHLLFPPFQAFNSQAAWVGTGWLEDIVFIYLFYGLTLIYLVPTSETALNFKSLLNVFKIQLEKVIYGEEHERMRTVFFYFTVVFFTSIISVQHRDISRYSLPLLPIALITFESFFTSKKFLIVLLFLIPAIYAYAWNFALVNTAPITEWSIFM